MVDFLTEQKLTLSEAARKVGVNPSTVWRWTLRGVRGIKLETYSIGAKRYTTEEALARFTEKCTAVAAGELAKARTSGQRDAAISRAEAELAKAGI